MQWVVLYIRMERAAHRAAVAEEKMGPAAMAVLAAEVEGAGYSKPAEQGANTPAAVVVAMAGSGAKEELSVAAVAGDVSE